MEIKHNIGNKINSNTLIKSIAWRCILDVVNEQKGHDIAPYLKSVDIKGNSIIIKTQNPLVNGEIKMVENLIHERIKKKLLIVGVSFRDFEIRYL